MMCFYHCTSIRVRRIHSCNKRDARVCKAHRKGFTLLVLALYVSQVFSAAPSISIQRAKALAGALKPRPSPTLDETKNGVLPQQQEAVASGRHNRLIDNVLGAISDPEIAQGWNLAMCKAACENVSVM